ncbi:MAG: glycosyltransferase, partial [Spirulinaceae cyanobacterium]
RFSFTPRYLPANSPIRIITVGRLEAKKGLEYGLKAIAILAKKHPDIEYHIVGEGTLRGELQKLIKELDIGSKVKLWGAKQQQEVIEIIDKSHLFLSPNVTSKDGNEDGPPNVIKEALAMGLPVVSTELEGIQEIVQDGVSGFLVPQRNAEALAQKLDYLIVHADIWPEMGQQGQAYVESHYDINRLNKQLIETYQQLLSKS